MSNLSGHYKIIKEYEELTYEQRAKVALELQTKIFEICFDKGLTHRDIYALLYSLMYNISIEYSDEAVLWKKLLTKYESKYRRSNVIIRFLSKIKSLLFPFL